MQDTAAPTALPLAGTAEAVAAAQQALVLAREYQQASLAAVAAAQQAVRIARQGQNVTALAEATAAAAELLNVAQEANQALEAAALADAEVCTVPLVSGSQLCLFYLQSPSFLPTVSFTISVLMRCSAKAQSQRFFFSLSGRRRCNGY